MFDSWVRFVWVKMTKTVVVRYRARGSSGPWRETKLAVNDYEAITGRISRFENENFRTIEIACSTNPFAPVMSES